MFTVFYKEGEQRQYIKTFRRLKLENGMAQLVMEYSPEVSEAYSWKRKDKAKAWIKRNGNTLSRDMQIWEVRPPVQCNLSGCGVMIFANPYRKSRKYCCDEHRREAFNDQAR